ncbi:MAG: alpha/beta fold hydrolase [Chloroflexota bacterium]
MVIQFAATLGGLLLILYIGYCAFLFSIQRQLLFPRHHIPANIAMAQPPDLEQIWVVTEHGRVEAWFLPPQNSAAGSPAPAIIYGHGNGEVIDIWPQRFQELTRLGIGVLLVEFPGYGRSEGEPSEESITATFIAAYDLLVAREDVDPSRIVLFGRSMGGGAITALAAQRPSAAMILQSTYTDVPSLTSRMFVPSFLVLDRFDNRSVVEDYAGPILIMHGTEDEVVPYEHGVELHRVAQNANLLTYNCGHNNCPPDETVKWSEIRLFLDTVGILTPPT